MADPFRSFQVGDPPPREAATYNGYAVAARMARDAGQSLSAGVITTPRDACIVRVKNETGRDLDQYNVVGLGDPIFVPADSEDAFKREATFRGQIPSTSAYTGKFGVLLEPAPIDRVVRAYVSGVCPVRIDVADGSHQFADVSNSDTTALLSSDFGSAQILWLDPDGYYGGYDSYYGADTKWAVVRIGGATGGAKLGKTRGSVTAKRSGTTVSSSVVDEYYIASTGTTGTLTVTGRSYRVFNLAGGATTGDVAANVYVGFSWRGSRFVFDLEDCGT